MRIAFLDEGAYLYASGHASGAGGTERDEWLLARALVKTGWSAAFGVRSALQAGEQLTIDGVKFKGIGDGQVYWAWRKFLSTERPDWLFWQGADHIWGLVVEIAKLTGVRSIFSAAFDSDVRPSQALSRRHRWWPLMLGGSRGLIGSL